MKKIVITGGAGFIGSWVLRELFLKYEDAEFAIIDNLCCGSSKTIERYNIYLKMQQMFTILLLMQILQKQQLTPLLIFMRVPC